MYTKWPSTTLEWRNNMHQLAEVLLPFGNPLLRYYREFNDGVFKLSIAPVEILPDHLPQPDVLCV